MDPRAELKRLLRLARDERAQGKLWADIQRVFHRAGEPVTHDAYNKWLAGTRFPANKRRQDLLAQAVGGKLGEAIRNLPLPPFRAYRQGIAAMTHHKFRSFHVVTREDESGKRTPQAEIMCAECGKTFHHSRRGSLEDEEYFRKKGWEVGTAAKYDFCPICVMIGKKGKVVQMSDHKKPEAVPAVEMTKLDGRLIHSAIGEHWDDNGECYQPGWSDAKLAEKEKMPIEWVRTVREANYGGVGEDPTLANFIAEQVTLKTELDILKKDLDQLASSSAQLSHDYKQLQDKQERLLESFRDKLSKATTKAHKLGEVAEKLKPPFSKAS